MGCLIRTANGTYYAWLHPSWLCQVSKAGHYYLLPLKQYLIVDSFGGSVQCRVDCVGVEHDHDLQLLCTFQRITSLYFLYSQPLQELASLDQVEDV